MNYFNYIRRRSSVVEIGNTPLGGNHPIRLQSMTNRSTLDTEGCIAQSTRIIDAGGEYVRLTAQGVREAENLAHIRAGLHSRGYTAPLVADIHFNPKAAEAAALRVEKVRINPGNFVDGVKRFDKLYYTLDEYAQEIEKIRQRFVPLLNLCRQHHTALRIGVNHGSLSNRIMSRYGDTPEGMVESCMEFLRICVAEHFPHVVISIKSSNTVVMVRTVRLMAATMEREQMNFPLHLGVTEAGDGEDGRVKSALGIGALLSDGIGDTIRVSLSEDPECEIPVAKALVDYIVARATHPPIDALPAHSFNYFAPERREGRRNASFTSPKPVVWANAHGCLNEEKNNCFELTLSDLTPATIAQLKQTADGCIVLKTTHANGVGEQRAFFHRLLDEGIDLPVVIEREYRESDLDLLRIKAAADFGTLLLDGFGDGICIVNHGSIADADVESCGYAILQAARLLFTKTEYISCPSCGRTLFDIQKTIAAVKAATQGYPGLKIGIMGCVVNGPGEMADADFGYVGSGRGKVDLYCKTTCVEKGIAEDEAVEKLVELIKLHEESQNTPNER